MRKSFCLSIFIFLTASSQAADFLTKNEAISLLKKGSFRWQQTKLLYTEAESLHNQAKAAEKIHIMLHSREYVGRLNHLQFGFPDPGNLNFFTIGSTSAELVFNIIDYSAFSRAEAAFANEKMVAANVNQYQNDLTYYVLVQFLNVQRLKEKINLIEAVLTRDSAIYKIAELRVKNQMGLKVDLMRAKSLVAFDNLKKIEAIANYAKAQQELANILGVSKLEKEVGPLKFNDIGDVTSEKLSTNRFDLKASFFAIEATRKLKEEAENTAKPKLSFMLDTGVVGTHLIGGAGSALTGSVGFQLSMPIYTGGYISAKVDDATAKMIKAEYQNKQLELDINSQISTAAEQFKNAKMLVDVSANHKSTADEELRLIKKRYSSGASSGLELTTSQTNLASAEDGHIEAVFLYEVSKVNYFKSIGQYEEYFKWEGHK